MKTKAILPVALVAAALTLPAQVPYERIRRAEAEPGAWLTYSGTYNGHRYSALKQITTANVKGLKPVWLYQTSNLNKFETSPLVVDGIMYISDPPGNVSALDVRTGRPLWTYRRNLPGDIRPCCGQMNRGLAMLDDSLFLGTLDAHLIALDSRNGRLRWDVVVADYTGSKGQGDHRSCRRRIRRSRVDRRLRSEDGPTSVALLDRARPG